MNILKGEKPTIYSWNELYFPGELADNLVIPAKGSIIVDDRDAENITILYVKSVNDIENTFETSPVKTQSLAPDWDSEQETWDISEIDYGNNRLYMYYTRESANANGGFKITIDKRIIVPGNDVDVFEIVKVDQEGNYRPVSMYFDSNGVYAGTRVPFTEVSANLHVPSSLHSVEPMIDNDVFRLVVYDYAGTQTGEYKLFAKKAIINNTAFEDLMIVGFVLEATQQNANGFYLLPGQDPDALMITPKLVLNDGRTMSLPIDGNLTQLYGLEGFISSSPGQETDILVKYFLHASEQAYGSFLNEADGVRYLVAEEKVIVLDIPDSISCKISVVPRYYAINNKYVLTFFLYTHESNTVRDITHLINVDNFDGDNFTTEQEVTISFDMSVVYEDVTIPKDYNQYLKIKLAPYGTPERWSIYSAPNDIYGGYGIATPGIPRPVITFDADSSRYSIPATTFDDVDRFLEAFYYKARPLYESSSVSEPIRPTHFTIRDVSTNTIIIENPISIDSFDDPWVSTLPTADSLVNSNCIVEFLEDKGAGVYGVLYGVPVDVYLSGSEPSD